MLKIYILNVVCAHDFKLVRHSKQLLGFLKKSVIVTVLTKVFQRWRNKED